MEPIMRTTIPMLLAAAIASTIASPSLAQAPAASTGTASASASAVGNLQSEIAALNLMTDAIGPATKDSEARIAQMQAFMAAKNLTGAYRGFTPTIDHPPLTFQQAYSGALQQQSLRGIPQGMPTDLDQLSTEAQATTTLVQQSWDRLNRNLDTIASMTEFLTKQGQMDAYMEWAPTYQKERKQAEAEKIAQQRAAADAAAQQQSAAHEKALRELQQRWDQMHYVSTGIDYHYQFSQGVPPGSQTGDTQFSQGVPPGSQMGYYNGSYYNGYADPYYDIWWDNTHLNFSNWGPAGGWTNANSYWGNTYPNYANVDVNNWRRHFQPSYRPTGGAPASGGAAAGARGR
jgi:hypothetical protein